MWRKKGPAPSAMLELESEYSSCSNGGMGSIVFRVPALCLASPRSYGDVMAPRESSIVVVVMGWRAETGGAAGRQDRCKT